MKSSWDCLLLPNEDADEAIRELESNGIDYEYLYDNRILVDSMERYEIVLDAAEIEYEFLYRC